MKKMIIAALALGSAVAFARGPAEPQPVQTCSWPAWENCGDTSGGNVTMTCAQARAYVAQNGTVYFNTEDGGQIGPVYKQVTCGYGTQVAPAWITTSDSSSCLVGEQCNTVNSGGGHSSGGSAGGNGGGHAGGHR